MTTENYYHDLPALESFADAIETDRHVQVPGDWWIVVADVTGSTQAIESGAYKKVNTVGAACIAAVVNVDRSVDIPFVFGGDGATFAVPDTLRERVIPALREAQRLSRQSFDLSVARRHGAGFDACSPTESARCGLRRSACRRTSRSRPSRDVAGKRPSEWSRIRWPRTCCGSRSTRGRARAASRVSSAAGKACRASTITSSRCWSLRCRTTPT